MNENKEDKWHKIRITVVSVIIILLMITGFLIFLRPVESDLEKRKLAVFPTPTLAAVLNGSFFTDISKWYADTYPLREKMIAFQSNTEDLYGIRNTVIYGDTGQKADAIPKEDGETAPIISDIAVEEDSDKTSNVNVTESLPDGNNGSVSSAAIVQNSVSDGSIQAENKEAANRQEMAKAENRGFTLYYFYKKGADLYASMLNTVAKKIGNSAMIYDIVVPNSFGVNLDEDIQKNMNTSNQGEAINYIYKKLNKSIKTVETYNQLRNHNSEYLYFKTDHHWTALGAYYVYRSFCETKGIHPHELGDYKKKKFPDFLGSFYAYSNQSKALKKNPDTVEAYIPIATNKEKITPREGKPYQYDIISDANKFSSANKYLAFIGGDQPLIEINNPKLKDDSSCIIIKESYGNAFVPFLVDHYQYVYVVDYRYYTGDVAKVAAKHTNTDIIFLNNTAATSVEKSKLMLGIFK